MDVHQSAGGSATRNVTVS